MDEFHALHTAARRHCMERHRRWSDLYSRPQVGVESPAERRATTFPRYLVWEAILAEVEREDPHASPSLDALRLTLVGAGWRARTAMTDNPALSEIQLEAMAEERADFERFLSHFDRTALVEVEPLEPRRVFKQAELAHIWDRLQASWHVTAGESWWPLRRGTPPADVLSFHTDWFDKEKRSHLIEILSAQSIGQTWEMREFREWGCESSLESFNPLYTGEEGYWTSASFDWLIYASHESSITLAGKWLSEAFCLRFPESRNVQYVGPMSTPDKRGGWT